MTIHCPRCQSEHINTKNYGKKAGSTLGTVAGALSVGAIVVRGAEMGGAAGTLAGPVGTVLGTLATKWYNPKRCWSFTET